MHTPREAVYGSIAENELSRSPNMTTIAGSGGCGASQPRRRRPGLRLGTLMLVVLGLGLWLGRWANRSRDQARAVRAATLAGATVRYADEDDSGSRKVAKAPGLADAVRRQVGDEYFRDADRVHFPHDVKVAKTPEERRAERAGRRRAGEPARDQGADDPGPAGR